MNDSFTNAKWLFVHSNTLKTYEQYVRVKHGNIVLYNLDTKIMNLIYVR